MKKKWKKYLTSIILLGVIVLVLFGYAKNKREQTEIKSLISEGMGFYSKEERSNLKIDSYLLLREIAKHIDAEDENLLMEESIYDKDLFVGFLNKDKFPSSLNSMMLELYPPHKVNLNNEYARTEPFAGVLLKALYCNKLGYTDYDFEILSTLYKKDGSYWDTHFLLSLLFLKNNNCYDIEKTNLAIREVSKSIIKAQKQDTEFTDVYAERIVMLYWAGYGNAVQKDWIKKVKENFIENPPGWSAVNSLPHPNSHTTGLAILSLLYYLERNSYQSFY